MEIKLPVPLRFRRGSLREDEAASVLSALNILDYVAQTIPLAGRRVLDFGCGCKLAQGLLQQDYGIEKYVGLDVYKEMIEFLQANVADARFSFETLDFKNEMYNKAGEPMTSTSSLPIPDETFDLIAMFSVITHMNPSDAAATLGILRGYAAADAQLVFSTFVNAKQDEPFVDLVPDRPLLRASYRRDYMETIIAQAGWRIAEFRPPIPQVIQHHYICVPA